MKLSYKISTALAVGALMSSVLAPAAFAQGDIDISGNGAGSHNTVNVSSSEVNSLSQSNSQTVVNDISSVANSGGNEASFNTGGNVTVGSGSATSTIGVSVEGGSNNAVVPLCGCLDGLIVSGISIVKNGVNSHNTINKTSAKTNVWAQANTSTVVNNLYSKAKSGKNKANYNTGGSVSVVGGGATSTVGVSVSGSSNTLNP